MTQIGHRAKFYFMCNNKPWDLSMVPNKKKIHPAMTEECEKTD